jgi:hypothetical protein
MAVYKLFPIADTTLYSGYPSMNTGLDEIIEASTNFTIGVTETSGQYPQTSRYLIKFDSLDINDIINNRISGSTWQSNLRVFIANATGLSNTSSIAINAVAENWSMGTGHYLESPEVNNGCSWFWKDYSGSARWTTSSFISGTTGSYDLTNNPSSSGGGVWYTGSQASQSFNFYSDLDLNTNVTSIISEWYSSSFINYGFIVRQTESQEFIANNNSQVSLKYFSRDTHTIYPPQLEFKWNDFTYSTGSLTVLNVTPARVTIDQNPGVFYSSSVNIFSVNAAPEYPTRAWVTSSVYTQNYALPTASYYAIKDLDTDEYVIDFDTTYTKLSCNSSGSFFTLYMNGLEPERYYKILIQTTINGSTLVFDNNYNFKIVNG